MEIKKPEVGELWEIILPSRTHYEIVRQLRIYKITELTYSFMDPDSNPYCPILTHIPIDNCRLLKCIPENLVTRINGIPDTYYENFTNKKSTSSNISNWFIDKNKYLSGEIAPN